MQTPMIQRHEMTILVVDDTPFNLTQMSAVLKKHYNVREAFSGPEALAMVRSGDLPDLILLDIMMPGMDGYEVCRQLKADPATANVPVIFLTANVSSDDGEKGFELGAVDYITKPIRQRVVLARIKTHLQLKASADFLEDKAAFLENEVARRSREIEAIQDVTILAMASMAETRDNETGNHIRRTQFYVRALADKLKKHPRFSNFLTERTINMLFKSAPLHDIGKVGIPDHILLKPGRFTPAEFEVMKAHTTLGRDAIINAERRLGISVDFLNYAKEIAYSHQEKWDGSGYPEGLAGDAIPVSARIMTVADVYDALISRRPYKNPFPHDKAVQMIIDGRGSHFDPDMVDAFVELQDEFYAISQRYADSDEDIEEKTRQIERMRST
ncbi:two-component system response regulator [Ferribacterium limneticum]|nr:two-component system response regulator [Ferribacterium limneticum]UCV31785.1 two-component system response regulator [Ferribacterium limneticum]